MLWAAVCYLSLVCGARACLVRVQAPSLATNIHTLTKFQSNLKLVPKVIANCTTNKTLAILAIYRLFLLCTILLAGMVYMQTITVHYTLISAPCLVVICCVLEVHLTAWVSTKVSPLYQTWSIASPAGKYIIYVATCQEFHWHSHGDAGAQPSLFSDESRKISFNPRLDKFV